MNYLSTASGEEVFLKSYLEECVQDEIAECILQNECGNEVRFKHSTGGYRWVASEFQLNAADYAIMHICDLMGVTEIQLLGKGRKTILVQTRYMIFTVLRERGWTLTAIGKRMKRDHATVIHGLEEHHTFMRFNINYKTAYNLI